MNPNFKQYQLTPSYSPYPPYHSGDYLETYFYKYLIENNIKTKRIFIPISWTACYLENKTDGLQKLLDSLDNNKSYFVVSQHDDAVKEKLPDDTVRFCAGGNRGGIPIPLVCSPIPKQDIIKYSSQNRDLLCSFSGSITHSIRLKLVNVFNNLQDVSIQYNDYWTRNISKERYYEYITTALRSRFLLCPRGYGLNSFRLYESFQLGCVPVVISDKNFLPWEDELNWDSFAVINNDIENLYELLSSISINQYQDLLNNGKKIYENYFSLYGTCNQIIKRINNI